MLEPVASATVSFVVVGPAIAIVMPLVAGDTYAGRLRRSPRCDSTLGTRMRMVKALRALAGFCGAGTTPLGVAEHAASATTAIDATMREKSKSLRYGEAQRRSFTGMTNFVAVCVSLSAQILLSTSPAAMPAARTCASAGAAPRPLG